MLRLKNKKVLITAAAQGIGRASAELFHQQGAQVIATDVNMPLLKTTQVAEHHYLDVTDLDNIHQLQAQIGNVDILFNCAGVVQNGGIMDCSEDDWAACLALNVTSVYRLCQAFIPGMLAQKTGSIINMASVASSITGVGNRFSYGASKAAVIGMTKAMAAEFVANNIRVNAICPGTIESPSLEQRMAANGDYEASRKAFVQRQPMGRLGQPIEVAQLALYLASDESSFTTGQVHVVDGGWTI
ncbi:SDR family oxidoreductase [Alteromonas pelagimontana]|uniref:SDR family oxidoreductase n=1 Tax=Alteromonas pelagimontana TaxID=1858656 RepID=A0A6M4MGR8_9ALTE|nr:SDR family oxidoreductase [Alteromonas pelagimontana]QJR82273.1 SDR family oxidoreductase [Alteromonas pelagimontana]